MQGQKIFEENLPKAEPVVEQDPGVAPHSTAITNTNTTNNPSMVQDTKPAPTPSRISPGAGARRRYQRASSMRSSRLQILEDKDDGLTCRSGTGLRYINIIKTDPSQRLRTSRESET